MITSNAGIKLIESFEGVRLKAYKLSGESYYTIGYGHSYDSSINASTTWTMSQAEAALKKDLSKFEVSVNNIAVKKFPKLNQNQFDALVSYTYNRGAGGLTQLVSNSSSISNMGNNIVVYWGSAVAYKNGLIARRKQEQALYNTIVKLPTFTVGKTYTLLSELKVRKGPGTNYDVKKRSELLESGKNKDKDKDGYLDKGVKIKCVEVKKNSNSNIWVKCPNGWVAAYYNGEVYLK